MTATLGFIGAGNMAGAIIGGLLRQKKFAPGEIGVYDVSAAALERCAASGLTLFDSAESLVAACGTIVLSVKPQVFPAVLPAVKSAMTPDKLLVSIAAGITPEAIRQAVGFPCKLVLAMPNTPLLVGAGATALARVEPTTPAEFETVKKLFEAAGTAEELDPSKMKESIPIHGSSPAFIYLFAKTIAECAEQSGVELDVAVRLLGQTLEGCARMISESGKPLQDLIDMVCSPGGTTLAALEALEAEGFSRAIKAAFKACIRRAEELSGQ